MTGAEIKAFRRRELLTQEMLAQAIGVLQAHISSWEKEARPIPAEQETKLRQLMGASSQERREMLAEIRKEKADAERGRKLARQARSKKPPKPPEKEPAKPVESAKPATAKTANPCKGCPYWQHMDRVKSKTMYCACFQETGHSRICGVERTYQRYRGLSPLSLDAARAAELGVSYGQYKAGGI